VTPEALAVTASVLDPSRLDSPTATKSTSEAIGSVDALVADAAAARSGAVAVASCATRSPLDEFRSRGFQRRAVRNQPMQRRARSACQRQLVASARSSVRRSRYVRHAHAASAITAVRTIHLVMDPRYPPSPRLHVRRPPRWISERVRHRHVSDRRPMGMTAEATRGVQTTCRYAPAHAQSPGGPRGVRDRRTPHASQG
jgi:hypothetical protein